MAGIKRTASIVPQRLSIPELTAIHIKDPQLGKAIQAIMDYINKNVTPVQGNKVS